MASTVTVRMNTCGKTLRVTVSRRDDGDLDVSIDSDCASVTEYAGRVCRISEMDVIDFASGAVNAPENRRLLTATCLVSSGIAYAASLELGLLTRRLAETVGSDEIAFD